MLIIHVSCKKYYKILSPNKHCKFTLVVLMSLGENIAVENTCKTTKKVLPIEHTHSPLLPLCTFYRIYSIHNGNNEVVVLMYLTY